MLQSEFFERTKVDLTGEEYAEVEFLYMNVEMDKDEFCKWWLKNRTNKLFQQVGTAYRKDVERKNEDVDRLYEENKMLKAQLVEKDRVHEDILSETLKKKNAEFMSFVRNLITANEDSARKVYDVIEEECGIGFIIRTKREAGIPLSESEIDYMVGKL